MVVKLRPVQPFNVVNVKIFVTQTTAQYSVKKKLQHKQRNKLENKSRKLFCSF